jgi:hypothetical protein
MIVFGFRNVTKYQGRPMSQNIYCEIRCCIANSPGDRAIKFTEEGLICKNPLSKQRTLFITYLDLDKKKINQFQDFLERNNFFKYDSVYKCSNRPINGNVRRIILRKDDTFKTIVYDFCYNSKLDSIFMFMNDFVPKDKRELYEVEAGYPYEKNCECK